MSQRLGRSAYPINTSVPTAIIPSPTPAIGFFCPSETAPPISTKRSKQPKVSNGLAFLAIVIRQFYSFQFFSSEYLIEATQPHLHDENTFLFYVYCSCTSHLCIWQLRPRAR